MPLISPASAHVKVVNQSAAAIFSMLASNKRVSTSQTLC
jgi:hypothetical protein